MSWTFLDVWMAKIGSSILEKWNVLWKSEKNKKKSQKKNNRNQQYVDCLSQSN